jgi:uncharacterized OB-fold protein
MSVEPEPVMRPPRGGIGVPTPSRWSAEFWAGCNLGELRYQRCDDCGSATHTPAPVCSSCGGPRLRWTVSFGRGTIYSYTTVWRPQTPAFPVPYAPVIVELDEGWLMLSNVIGCSPDALAIGCRVEVEFRTVAGEAGQSQALPYFRLTSPPPAEFQ